MLPNNVALSAGQSNGHTVKRSHCFSVCVSVCLRDANVHMIALILLRLFLSRQTIKCDLQMCITRARSGGRQAGKHMQQVRSNEVASSS